MNYDELRRRLRSLYDDGESTAIARLVMEKLFAWSVADIVCEDKQLSEDEQALLEKTAQRLEKGEPAQYVLGEALFSSRPFHVERGVLIPRPETEELVCHVTREAGKNALSPLNILDIGTGSGCIAVTLALDIKGARVEAWDISRRALAIAEDNARRLGAAVILRRRDILTAERRKDATASGETRPFYHIIVSNPPYVTMSERRAMHRNILEWEPSEALFVPDDDPLLFYRAIARYALPALTDGGRLFLELNPLFAADVAALIRGEGFMDITLRRDDNGKERFLDCVKRRDDMTEMTKR